MKILFYLLFKFRLKLLNDLFVIQHVPDFNTA